MANGVVVRITSETLPSGEIFAVAIRVEDLPNDPVHAAATVYAVVSRMAEDPEKIAEIFEVTRDNLLDAVPSVVLRSLGGN